MGRLGILFLAVGFVAACGSDLVVNNSVSPATDSPAPTTSFASSTEVSPSTTQVPVKPPVSAVSTTDERAAKTAVAVAEPVLLGTSPDGHLSYYSNVGELLVDDGSGAVRALNDERDRFHEIGDVTFGEDDLIGWVSYDNNFGGRVLLGRIAQHGMIVDAHPLWGEAQQLFDQERDLAAVLADAVKYGIDPGSDPFFVMTSRSPPMIDTTTPLVPVIENEGYWARSSPGSWYVGETLSLNPACGATTLYKDDADGFARVLAGDLELDTISAVYASETFNGAFDTAFARRLIVLTTECADEYAGRRIFVGWESVNYGDGGPRFEQPLHVVPLVDYEVTGVAAVTVIPLETGDCCAPRQAVIDVELLDGEVETITWPADDSATG